jgi:hypothetical protein
MKKDENERLQKRVKHPINLKLKQKWKVKQQAGKKEKHSDNVVT